MSTLHEVVHRSKILSKSLGKRIKTVRKHLEKVARGKAAVEKEQLQEEVAALRMQLREVLDLEATRILADANESVDVVVDGEAILSEVPVALLLVLRQELKYQKKFYETLTKVGEDPFVETVATRIGKLQRAVEAAIDEGNERTVEQVLVSVAVDEFLFSQT